MVWHCRVSNRRLTKSRQASSSVSPPLAQPAARSHGSKRLVRPALGGGFLVLSAWALLPLLLSLHSTQAVINTAVGDFAVSDRGHGQFPLSDSSWGKRRRTHRFSASRASWRTKNVSMRVRDERSYLAAKISSSRQELTNLSALRKKSLAVSARKYQEARLRTLELECDEAKASVDGARSVERQRNSGKDQLAQLGEIQSISGLDAGGNALRRPHERIMAWFRPRRAWRTWWGANPLSPRRRERRAKRRTERPPVFQRNGCTNSGSAWRRFGRRYRRMKRS